MQLTIDSTEPLADVIRVVGSLYGVTLTASHDVGDGVGVGDTVPDANGRGGRSAAARRPRRRGSKPARGGRDSGRGGVTADPRVVREWAAANGFAVSARGSLPAQVRAAYAQAHVG